MDFFAFDGGFDRTTFLTKLLPKVITLLVLSYVFYGIGLGFYRLYLSPLAKFPGPKLAALTQWYEIYFDMVPRGGGQFPFEIKRMHDVYGPIVRINPWELHIGDPEYHDTLYANNKPYDKMTHFQFRFSVPSATFNTADEEEHRIRRAAINPFFSKTRVRARNDEIQALMDRVSHRLSTEYAGTGKVLHFEYLWGCFMADVIMDIVFARPKHFSQYPNFESPFTISIRNMAHWAHATRHFGWILTIVNSIPHAIAKAVFPPFKPIIEFREGLNLEIREMLAGRNEEAKNASQPTVFHDILSSDLPPHELSPERLTQEAVGLVGAGIETTGWSMTVGTFHIIDNPHVFNTLKEELIKAIPDPEQHPSWAELEQLPYLTAVVKETLRMGMGGVERLPRINRTGILTYDKYVIPAGTPVGMDQYHTQFNENIYSEPNVFKPERWLGDPRGPDGIKPLTHYLTIWGKGSRSCAGLQLAYAEMYIGFSTLFRRHEFEFFETTRRDVDFAKEMLKPSPWPGSKGVRVFVK